MPTPLRIVEQPKDQDDNPHWWSAEPGDMWRCLWDSHVVEGRDPCWVIRMPGQAWVWHTNDKDTKNGNFWNVTGEVPNITVHPSINIGPEIWHGWIKNGQMDP